MVPLVILVLVGVGACGRLGFESHRGAAVTDAATDVIPLMCGNGIIDVTETCDDGNQRASDGCAACELEDQGAGGGTCATPRTLELVSIASGRAGVGSGTTVGGIDTIRSTCIPDTPSPEAIYKLVITAPGDLHIKVEPSSSDNGDALVYVRRDSCGASSMELACVDASGPAGEEETTVAVTPGSYFIVIELLRNSNPSTPGAIYKLEVELAPS